VVVISVIPALQRLGQEDPEYKVSLGYIAEPCLKNIYIPKLVILAVFPMSY
jgi:hypothetical protein